MMPLVVANWKMHGTVDETLKMITELSRKSGGLAGVELAIAPPFTALYSASIVLQETSLKLAAQNLHWETEGAYTGEISALFLKEIGCHYVIIGHSERRKYFGETDEEVNKKVRTAIAAELVPILCIGETAEERKGNQTEAVLEKQLKKALLELPMYDLKDLVIAYEPVWAIGTGQTATTDQIGEAHGFIRNLIAKRYDAPTANRIRILYGGSVSAENAPTIAGVKNVNGFLVGKASLSADQFFKIAAAALTMLGVT